MTDHDYRVISSEPVHAGSVFAVRRDELVMPGGGTAVRDVVRHPGAVAVVALDDQERIVLVRQYRHPVGRRLDELPAGLLDAEGEPPLDTARRELAEEAGLAAETWHVLVDLLTTPGMSDEAARIYLAQDLRVVHRDVQEHEESELTSFRVQLADVVERVLAGEYENALLVAGALAAHHAIQSGGARIRPAAASWPARPEG